MRRSNGRGLETGALRTAPALDPTITDGDASDGTLLPDVRKAVPRHDFTINLAPWGKVKRPRDF